MKKKKNMKIMLDTNILVFAGVFNSEYIRKFIKAAVDKNHSIVLCSYVINELYSVINRKFPSKIESLNKFFSELEYDYIETPDILPEHGMFTIRDKKDEKVLYSAILADVDILITGDKDFSDIKIKRPEIYTPAEFLEKYADSI